MINSTQVMPSEPKSAYDLNLRLVFGMRVIGKGHVAAKSLCGIMNLPPPPTVYSRHERILAGATQTLCQSSMTLAVEEAVKENDNLEKRDLCVAVDGSWQKRGHRFSNIGGHGESFGHRCNE